MKTWLLLAGAVLPLAAAGAMPGVDDAQRAQRNWMMQCQGCHGAAAAGNASGVPGIAGAVARFLGVEGGREYLIRVPGVANAALSDERLAELLNWTLQRFAGAHVPAHFVPFTADEIAALRQRPYASEAFAVRAALLAALADKTGTPGGAEVDQAP